jgi:hypothetical protein
LQPGDRNVNDETMHDVVRIRGGLEQVPTSEITDMSTQSEGQKKHLHEGMIFRDRSNNVVRLLSGYGDYCTYVYVSLTNNLRSTMHGTVTGRTRRDVFGADFVFIAGSVEDWIGNQRKSNRPADALTLSLPADQSCLPGWNHAIGQ